MIDKESLGLLMGAGLALAFAGWLLHILAHPDRYGWLTLAGKAAPPPAETGGRTGDTGSTSSEG